jgi:hypothetical protein
MRISDVRHVPKTDSYTAANNAKLRSSPLRCPLYPKGDINGPSCAMCHFYFVGPERSPLIIQTD